MPVFRDTTLRKIYTSCWVFLHSLCYCLWENNPTLGNLQRGKASPALGDHHRSFTKLSVSQRCQFAICACWEPGSTELLVLASCPKSCESHGADWPPARGCGDTTPPGFLGLVAAPESCTTALCNRAGPSTGAAPAGPINLMGSTAENMCHERLQLSRSSSQDCSSFWHWTELKDASPTSPAVATKKGWCGNKGDQGWGGRDWWDGFWQQDSVQGSPVISSGDGAVCQAGGAEILQNARAKCCRKRGRQNCPEPWYDCEPSIYFNGITQILTSTHPVLPEVRTVHLYWNIFWFELWKEDGFCPGFPRRLKKKDPLTWSFISFTQLLEPQH